MPHCFGLPNNVQFSEHVLRGMFTAVHCFHEGQGAMDRTLIARRGLSCGCLEEIPS